jgi:hypothetical protein
VQEEVEQALLGTLSTLSKVVAKLLQPQVHVASNSPTLLTLLSSSSHFAIAFDMRMKKIVRYI